MVILDSADMTWAGATSVDMGATVNSDPFPVNRFRTFSVNANWGTANSPVGTLDVQVCNAHTRNGTTLTTGETANWTTLASLQAKPGTDTPPGLQHVQVNGFAWVRLVYTRTSGGSGDKLSAQLQGVTT